MIASRRCAKAATSWSCTQVAWPSGPRWTSSSLISSTVPRPFGKGLSERLTAPPIPHMGGRIRPRASAPRQRSRHAARPGSRQPTEHRQRSWLGAELEHEPGVAEHGEAEALVAVLPDEVPCARLEASLELGPRG